MPKLPQISGEELIRFLQKIGYRVIRQKGSHVRLRKKTQSGVHNITVPFHKEIAKGTLNDIISKVSVWNNISKKDLIEKLRKAKI